MLHVRESLFFLKEVHCVTLPETIIKALGKDTPSHREMEDTISEQHLVSHRGLLVLRAQVRAVIRESARFFEIDKSRPVYLIHIHR